MGLKKPQHFLTGCEFDKEELAQLLDEAERLRLERRMRKFVQPLAGQTLALLFEKPSLRTRVSFTVAAQELGASVIELNGASLKKEEPEDTIRVLGGYCDALMVRTFAHDVLERMTKVSKIPVINGLSDLHHPCQALADLLTLTQEFGELQGLKLAYIGDGNNVLHSILLLAPFLGVELRYSCPAGYGPDAGVLAAAKARCEDENLIQACASPIQAVEGANALYTDVWTSMGFEAETAKREEAFAGYQVNEELYSHAAPGAIVMHCLPMVRGKEITDEMADHSHSRLFQQSENRLHVQKALLRRLMNAQAVQAIEDSFVEMETRSWRQPSIRHV